MYVALEKERRKYGSRMYTYHCDGKWLMNFQGFLLMFLFYLKYERHIRRVVHTKTI
jgi:hypothetical protein